MKYLVHALRIEKIIQTANNISLLIAFYKSLNMNLFNTKNMKIKTFFTLLLVSLAFSMNAQTTDQIVGNWIFKEALNQGIDEAGMALIEEEVIDKWTFSFQSNGTFETFMMGEKGTGQWKLSSDNKSIIISGMEGSPLVFNILKFTKNELALKLGLGEFLLKRKNVN